VRESALTENSVIQSTVQSGRADKQRDFWSSARRIAITTGNLGFGGPQIAYIRAPNGG
jgi:hypothetical protein